MSIFKKTLTFKGAMEVTVTAMIEMDAMRQLGTGIIVSCSVWQSYLCWYRMLTDITKCFDKIKLTDLVIDIV